MLGTIALWARPGLTDHVRPCGNKGGASTWRLRRASRGFTLNVDRLVHQCAAALVVLAAGLACSGGAPASSGNKSLVYRSATVAPGAPCPYGGMRIDVGIDDDLSGLLDGVEIDQTGYACNGAPGSNGGTTLVTMTLEPLGSRCPTGGLRVDTGLDDDGDGMLAPAEIEATRYVCSGANGPVGAPSLIDANIEPAGEHCGEGGYLVRSGEDEDGDGSLDAGEVDATEYVCHGQDGTVSLVRILPEAAGGTCLAGGVRIESGLDANRDGILDDGEVSASALVCGAGTGADACMSQCGASVCGADGCGGVCGTCMYGNVCDAGACVPGTAATGSVVGTVASAGVGLEGATVIIGTASVAADSGGHYRIDGVPAGQVTLSASKPSHRTAARQVTVVGGDTVVADVALVKVAELGGRITNAATGFGVAGLEVRAGALRSYTGADGRFLLSELPPGTWTVTLEKVGYASATLDARVEGGRRTTLDVAVAATGSVAGKVTSASSSALYGATVVVGGRVARTTATGDYVLSDVRPGAATVQISFAGYESRLVQASVTSGATTALDVTLTALSTAPATVTGAAVDFETGAPLVGVTVTAWGGYYLTTTSSGGWYSFSNLPPGPALLLRAALTGYEPVSLQSQVLGGTYLTWNPALKRLHDVYVIVMDAETGLGVPAAIVDRQPQSGASSCTTDETGVCALSVVSGSGSFVVSAPEYPQVRTAFAVPPTSASTTVTIALVRQPRVCGVVFDDASGAPVSGAAVEIWAPAVQLAATIAGVDGSYCLGYPGPGLIADVYASMPGYESASLTVTLPARGVVRADLPLWPATAAR
jgi:hypothetical protein